MLRSLLSSILFIGIIGLGVMVAALSSRNRARGAELDRRQLESETLERQNKLQRARNQRSEYRLMQAQSQGPAPIVEPISD